MSINLTSPSASPSANLVYDTGPNGETRGMTKVGGVTVSAAFEVQSTSGSILFPRMSSAQVAALPVLTDGMMLYDNNIADFVQRINGVWVPQHPAVGFLFSTGTLSNVQLVGMFAAGVQLLPAPGAGFMNVIHGFLLELIFVGAAFVNGGNVYLQYGNAGNSGNGATVPIPPTLFTAFVANQSSFSGGDIAELAAASSNNATISITNDTAPFVGAASTARYSIWYSIVAIS